jgi:hypothetical protein
MIPRTIRSWVGLTLTLLTGIALGSLIIEGLQRTPPLQVLDTYDAGDIAAHDGRIFIFQKVLRTRICRTETSRFLYTLVDHGGVKVPSVVQLEADNGVPFTDVGVASYVLSFKLPEGLWPGEWKFVSKTVDYCSPLDWFAPHRRESQPLPVDIERARAAPSLNVTTTLPGGRTAVRGRSPVAQ